MKNATETFCHQAPAGGAVSRINGQFYEGGEFMPVTGLSCGVKKSVKQAKQKADFAGARIVDAKAEFVSLCNRYVVTYRFAGSSYVRYLNSNGYKTADEAIAAAAALA